MTEFTYTIESHQKWKSFVDEQPESDKALQQLAEHMRETNTAKLPLPSALNLEVIQSTIDAGLILIDDGDVSFADHMNFLYFLARSASRNQFLKDWEDVKVFTRELEQLYLKKFEFSMLKDLPATLLIVLNQDFGQDVCKQFCRALNSRSFENFYVLPQIFTKALPFLRVECSDLFCVLSEFASNSGGFIGKPVSNLCAEQPALGEQIFEHLTLSHAAELIVYLPSVINGLSKRQGVSAVYDNAVTLMTEHEDIRFRQMGIRSCAKLDFADEPELLARTLRHFEQMLTDHSVDIQVELASAYGGLLSQSDLAKAKIRELSGSTHASIQLQVAKALFYSSDYFAEEWYQTSLLNLATAEIQPELILYIDSVLIHLIGQPEIIFNFFEKWVNHHAETDERRSLAHVFDRTFYHLVNTGKSALESRLTQWFCLDISIGRSAAS